MVPYFFFCYNNIIISGDKFLKYLRISSWEKKNKKKTKLKFNS